MVCPDLRRMLCLALQVREGKPKHICEYYIAEARTSEGRIVLDPIMQPEVG
jgi:hypothetical protein